MTLKFEMARLNQITQALDEIAYLDTNEFNQPIDASSATITKTSIIDDFSTSGFAPPERNDSMIKKIRLQLYGLVMTQKILSILLSKSFIEMYLKLQMV